MLYAGTDAGVYVSFDDGDHWQPLQRNLPVAWVRDLLVHGNDLIAATQGRAIWVLDDVTPLRQLDASIAHADAHLFAPAPAIRVRGSQNKDTPPPADTALGTNPPTGAIIDYLLPHAAKRVTLRISDAAGKAVRSYASDAPADAPNAERYFAANWTQTAPPLSAAAGAHRFVWNLRAPRPSAAHYDYSIAAVFGLGVPVTPEGMLMPPGDYTVVLDVDGQQARATLKVVADPRVALDGAALRAAFAFAAEIDQALQRDYVGVGQMSAVDEQIAELEKADRTPTCPRQSKDSALPSSRSRRAKAMRARISPRSASCWRDLRPTWKAAIARRRSRSMACSTPAMNALRAAWRVGMACSAPSWRNSMRR